MDADAGVILPKNAKLNQTQKKVEYFDDPQVDGDGRKIIGKITYTYKNKEVGGTNIYYLNKSHPTLNDSIDMSKWFDDAVEEVNKAPFPWKKAALIAIMIAAFLYIMFFVVQRIRSEHEFRSRRNHYKKTNKKKKKIVYYAIKKEKNFGSSLFNLIGKLFYGSSFFLFLVQHHHRGRYLSGRYS